MLTYQQRAEQAVRDSSLAVMVLLNPDNTDAEFVQCGPDRPFISREQFTARRLRQVGVVTLKNLQPAVTLREALPPDVVMAIATDYLEYLRVYLQRSFAEQMEAAEVSELFRLFALPDTRLPN